MGEESSGESGSVVDADGAMTVVDGAGGRTVVDPPLPGGVYPDAGATRVDPPVPGGAGIEAGPTVVWTRARLLPGLEARYRVDRELPGGGEADVLLCTELDSGEPRVIKQYRNESTVLDDAMLRVVHTDEKSFPHVVHSYKWGKEHETSFEIQEYVPNGSLADLLDREGPMVGERRAREVLEELAGALDHIHERGIVHRDLKPQNVLVRTVERLDLVLADFGLATVVENSRTMRSGSGTQAYAGPEAAWGDVSRGRDWWSVGIILVELLTGRHPFRRADGAWMEIGEIGNHLSTRPIDVTGIDDPRWRLLARGLLTRDPTDRWGIEQVQRWLKGESPEVATDADARSGATGVAPFQFEGQTYRDPTALAEALSTHWRAARRILAGARSDDPQALALRSWLSDIGADRATRIFVEDGGPDRRLVRLIVALDPDLPPSYLGEPMDLASVGRLAAKAANGDKDAQATLAAAYDADALGGLAGCRGHESLGDLSAQWRHTVASIDELVKTLPESVRSSVEEASRATKATALLSCDNVDSQRRVHEHSLEAIYDANAATVNWFEDLVSASSRTSNSLASDILLLLVAPLAKSDASEARAVAAKELEQRNQAEKQAKQEARLRPLAEWVIDAREKTSWLGLVNAGYLVISVLLYKKQSADWWGDQNDAATIKTLSILLVAAPIVGIVAGLVAHVSGREPSMMPARPRALLIIVAQLVAFPVTIFTVFFTWVRASSFGNTATVVVGIAAFVPAMVSILGLVMIPWSIWCLLRALLGRVGGKRNSDST